MKIFADQNILAVESRFLRHGDLRCFDGRSIRREDLFDADALLVRSITRVDETLLAGTKIKFVGTATSGVDHIDVEYLRRMGIDFAHAKGSNANAVVDYCFTALAYAVLQRGFSLPGIRVGIIGAGAVGGQFAAKLEALGIEVVCCDPILEIEESGREYCSLDEALACDVVSVHVPLTRDGPHPTYKMIGSDELEKLPSNAVLINACRGLVVDETALKDLLSRKPDLVTVFDVWADEPAIDAELAGAVDIATPHIAGYSHEAKLNATEILALAFEKHFELKSSLQESGEEVSRDLLFIEGESDSGLEFQTLLQAFPLHDLSARFKAEIAAGAGDKAFDSFRQKLLQRREFNTKSLETSKYSASQQDFLSALGFSFD